MTSQKIVVIGCTHAGTNAINSILTHAPSCKITVFERNDTISFLSCGIALWVEGIVKQPDLLFYNSPENLQKQGVVTKMKHEVLDIDKEKKVCSVKNLVSGEIFNEEYDKLILTTGSWPIIPPIPGINKNNIKLCKNYDHAKELVTTCGDKKRVIVVGAGYIGIELAEGFYAQKKEVVLIDALERVVPRYFDSDFTDIVEKEIKEKGIELYLGQVVKEFVIDENDNAVGLKTDKGIELKSDLIILCIGFRPKNELFKEKLELLNPNGPLKVNEYMQTSDPSIYAAGDCATIYSNVIDQTTYIPLATNAIRQGYIIGMNILENKFKHPGTQGTSGIKIFSYKLGSTGLTGDSAKFYKIETETVSFKDNHRPEFMPTYEEVRIKLVYEKQSRVLKGAQIISKYDLTQCMNIISVCIKDKMTIDELAFTDFFFQPYYNKPWHFINLCAQQALKK